MIPSRYSGLRLKALERDVKLAYWQLACLYHPDKWDLQFANTGTMFQETTAHFQLLNNMQAFLQLAYEENGAKLDAKTNSTIMADCFSFLKVRKSVNHKTSSIPPGRTNDIFKSLHHQLHQPPSSSHHGH